MQTAICGVKKMKTLGSLRQSLEKKKKNSRNVSEGGHLGQGRNSWYSLEKMTDASEKGFRKKKKAAARLTGPCTVSKTSVKAFTGVRREPQQKRHSTTSPNWMEKWFCSGAPPEGK